MKNEPYITIGKIGSTYGVKGWLKIYSYAESLDKLIAFDPWYLEEDARWTKIKRLGAKVHGKLVIAHIAGFDAPETARVLTGKKIAIHRSQLPPLKKGEYYWWDLEGMQVIDQHGQSLGNVVYLLATGANDVLVVKGKTEHAIPYLPGSVIKQVDIEKNEIHVDWELI